MFEDYLRLIEDLKMIPLEDIKPKESIKEIPLNTKMTDVLKVCQKMEALCLKENGIGLSAVQVGIPFKLFVIRATSGNKFDETKKFGYFLNVDYFVNFNDDYFISLEGCLSIRSKKGQLRHFQVPRYKKITINGYKLNYDKEIELQELKNITLTEKEQSVVFAHEIDHHNGITIDQIG